jgi:AAA family ATPase
VDLKYLTHTQIVEVVYEGHTRQFSVVSVTAFRAAKNESDDDLAEVLQSLSIQSKPQVWTVGWDSYVRILESKIDKKSEVAHKVLDIITIFSISI